MDVCHVCGGKAKAGSWWETIGFHEPEPFPESDFFDGAAWTLEVEVEEGGRLPRAELDRVMATLYPAPGSPLLYYRKAWRSLLDAFFGGTKTGLDRQREDARLKDLGDNKG